jgi:bifunctional DNA-binding transcriptional regulator/antitoxin component of YhaV-PrlF toxin-antitoxin module
VIREPAEVVVRAGGTVELPIGLLAEAGVDVGERLLAFSAGDGVIVLRRLEEAARDLLEGHGL